MTSPSAGGRRTAPGSSLSPMHDTVRAALRILAVGTMSVPAIFPSLAGAQGYPFSQRGAISQDVAFTTITVAYGRPVARGRPLFGQLVPWDSVWHPGADSATRVAFNHDVLVEGKPLKAGEYSLWLVPREHGPWTVIFSRAAHTFHKPYPGEGQDALRVDVATEAASHVETLEIEFPLVL